MLGQQQGGQQSITVNETRYGGLHSMQGGLLRATEQRKQAWGQIKRLQPTREEACISWKRHQGWAKCSCVVMQGGASASNGQCACLHWAGCLASQPIGAGGPGLTASAGVLPVKRPGLASATSNLHSCLHGVAVGGGCQGRQQAEYRSLLAHLQFGGGSAWHVWEEEWWEEE